MTIMNPSMYEAVKFGFGGGMPKAPGPPPPPPDPGGAAQRVKTKNISQGKTGRPQTILAGDTLGGPSSTYDKKTLLGG